MNRPVENHCRVTLMLHDSRERFWALNLSADCAQFIGRYPRLPAFRGAGALLDFLPQDRADQHR